jgi:hypothetical protein
VGIDVRQPRRRSQQEIDTIRAWAHGQLRPPARVVLLSQLQVVALAVHPHGDVADACSRVEPGPQRPERVIVVGQRVPGETECCSQELAALVEHALLMS